MFLSGSSTKDDFYGSSLKIIFPGNILDKLNENYNEYRKELSEMNKDMI